MVFSILFIYIFSSWVGGILCLWIDYGFCSGFTGTWCFLSGFDRFFCFSIWCVSPFLIRNLGVWQSIFLSFNNLFRFLITNSKSIFLLKMTLFGHSDDPSLSIFTGLEFFLTMGCLSWVHCFSISDMKEKRLGKAQKVVSRWEKVNFLFLFLLIHFSMMLCTLAALWYLKYEEREAIFIILAKLCSWGLPEQVRIRFEFFQRRLLRIWKFPDHQIHLAWIDQITENSIKETTTNIGSSECVEAPGQKMQKHEVHQWRWPESWWRLCFVFKVRVEELHPLWTSTCHQEFQPWFVKLSFIFFNTLFSRVASVWTLITGARLYLVWADFILFFSHTLVLVFFPLPPENLIGKGGYAEVYKGCLQDGQLVAVKRLWRGKPEEKTGNFLSELGIMAHVNHPNTAKLIGYGVEGGLHLILELSPHGSLATILHGQ